MNKHINTYQKRAGWTILAIGGAFAFYNFLVFGLPDGTHKNGSEFLGLAVLFIAAGAVVLNAKKRPHWWLLTISALPILYFSSAALAFILSPLTWIRVNEYPVAMMILLLRVLLYIVIVIYLLRVFIKLRKNIKRGVQEPSPTKKQLVQFITTIVLILALPLLFLVTAKTAEVLKSADPSHGKTNEIKQFLSKKYNQSFEITNFKTEKQYTSGFTSWDRLIATAHPASNDQIIFEVRGCVARCDSNGANWHDDYVRKAWAYEITPEISQEVEKIYGKKLDVEVSTGLTLDARNSMSEDELVAFDQARRYAFVNVSVSEAGHFTTDNIVDIERKSRQLADYLSGYGAGSFRLSFNKKDPREVPASVYSVVPFASPDLQSKVRCAEHIKIDSSNIEKVRRSANLKGFFSKTCGYKTEQASAGSVVRATYPE
ncbi:hypothetical protein CR983_00955 [Candidatus Saccharibacteria bacterium]|nr:MAG: hypothetical protein CR983_00955 [Candidatus Saccharibacteria bacterium]